MLWWYDQLSAAGELQKPQDQPQCVIDIASPVSSPVCTFRTVVHNRNCHLTASVGRSWRRQVREMQFVALQMVPGILHQRVQLLSATVCY